MSRIDEGAIREMVRRVVLRTLGTPKPARSRRERALVTQAEVEDVAVDGELSVPEGALITPLARQTAMERRIKLVRRTGTGREATGAAGPATRAAAQATSDASKGRTVALGADHGGWELKEVLKSHLAGTGYVVLDCGTESTDSVDYPDFALAVAQLVAGGRARRGIVIDGAGIGSCMAANKVPGVRAAMCYDEATASNSRAHNDANVLSLGAGMIGASLARRIVDVWLATPAEGGRHARRVEKIMDIERRYVAKG